MSRANPEQANLFSAWLSLLTSGGTLICCALPALFVALGAGAVLAGLVKTVPGIVWFSEYKTAMFIAAAAMLAISGALQWRTRNAPCPVGLSANQAADCARVRRFSQWVWQGSVFVFALGAFFAFALPVLQPWWAQRGQPVVMNAQGEVRRVDADRLRVVLKHEPISSIEMPAMTMPFPVQSIDLIQQLAVGDKINFGVEQKEGALLITHIEKM